MDQHWLFDLAEQDPERLLSMSEEDFRRALFDAGFDADELVDLFHSTIDEMFSQIPGVDNEH